MNRIEELRDYYDSHDTSAEMEQGQWETDVVDDPMITTSLRLPKSLLDWVRDQAGAEHAKPSAWIRALIERTRTGNADLAERVSALESLFSLIAAQQNSSTSPHQSAALPSTSASHKLRPTAMKERAQGGATRTDSSPSRGRMMPVAQSRSTIPMSQKSSGQPVSGLYEAKARKSATPFKETTKRRDGSNKK